MKLHFHEEGRGPAILLLHAFPLNSSMWKPQIATLRNSFRCIAPDMRGFGTTPLAGPWSLEDAADDLAELLDTLSVERCVVAGLSMGGYIALPFCARHGGRVHALVLANTRARADTEIEKEARTGIIAALEQSGSAILPERMLPRLLKPNPDSQVVKTVRDIMAATTATGAIFALKAMRDRPDRTSELGRISCPVLVISGEHDAITRIEECRAMADTIPNGTFKEIPNAGHLSNLENPAAFTSAMETWQND